MLLNDVIGKINTVSNEKNILALSLPLIILLCGTPFKAVAQDDRTRVIVTSDGEIDDECSLVRFLLYSNEWDIEGIITSSSQYHWHGHKWAGDDWMEPTLNAYAEVYPNLLKHDRRYPRLNFCAAVLILAM